jgi:hypothetical protein
MARTAATPAGENARVSTAVEKAENGFVVHVSSEKGGKNASFSRRTFVAPNGRAAMRIATTHMETCAPKMKAKKAKGKALAKKR